ncbi:hypothetical protein C1H76_7607 [Elsinoe australis]|uniref:Oxidoreductase-like domain-containing protein n=1 Tax=Elsinoe australis TaxID=40998 RepID=A0A4U7APX5_9PEZI|nr:hypothetical protein C1H76_7607 [Elsinoe australis]
MRTFLARSSRCAKTIEHRINTSFELGSHAHTTGRTIRPGFQRRYESNKPNYDQKIPLDGYYADILSRSEKRTSDSKPAAPSATPVPHADAAQTEKEEREARARVVFGSRLAGPERKRELEAGSTIIAGVKVPPKPEEPDNCCMSGCVNCVWDRFQDELEEWATASAEAKARLRLMQKKEPERGAESLVTKGKRESNANVMGEGLQTEIGKAPTHVAVSMDDDGGGSETNWALDAGDTGTEDLLTGIPVGIREFMRTEKRLKQLHAQGKTLDG